MDSLYYTTLFVKNQGQNQYFVKIYNLHIFRLHFPRKYVIMYPLKSNEEKNERGISHA